VTTTDASNQYHPDPLRTGSAREDDAACALCSRRDTAKYEGEARFESDTDVDEEDICIVCINDGTAHDRLGATFTGEFAAEDGWGDVPAPIIAAIRERTPAVFTWQAPRWLACCADACVYLGVVDESTADAAAGGADPGASVGPAGNTAPSWYVFRCTHCAGYRSFSDAP
jgi:uncharacterized protein